MKKIFLLILIVFPFLIGSQTEATVVIGGSTMESPPSFWDSSFWGMTSVIERAFPFTTILGNSFYVEELQIAAYHYEGLAGSQASFSIRIDDNGLPGQSLGSFQTNSITMTPQVLTLTTTDEIILSSDTAYWLVGQTPQGQVNWNLADNVFGTVAYRVGQDPWTVLSYSNFSAFVILGTEIPEPATLSLLTLGAMLMRRRRTRVSKIFEC